jgi:hypothetical protein
MFGNPKNFYVISVKASILTSLVSVNMIKFETSKIELFMKKALFCFFLLISGMTLSAQDVKTQPTTPELIKFSETSYDFGKIPQGKPVTHNFTLENIGTDTLKIENVQASCGCTTPEWSQEPIPAKSKSTIKVGYNAASEGTFEKTITIYYNGGQTKQIFIKGTVWKTPDQPVPQNPGLNQF